MSECAVLDEKHNNWVEIAPEVLRKNNDDEESSEVENHQSIYNRSNTLMLKIENIATFA